MPFQQAKENLEEFGEELRLTGLEFDENKTCILGIDDKYSLHLTYEPNGDRLYAYSPLLDGLPEDPTQRLVLYKTLLEHAMLGGKLAGGGVGLAEKEGLILMHITIDMSHAAKPSALREIMPMYVETVEKMRALCVTICNSRPQMDEQIPPMFSPALRSTSTSTSMSTSTTTTSSLIPTLASSLTSALHQSPRQDVKRKKTTMSPELLFEWLKAGNLDEDTLLDCIKGGADVNLFKNNVTLLYLAVEKGLKNIVAVLLGYDANPNIIINNETPLHKAAAIGRADIVRELLSKHADLFTANDQEETALHVAVRCGHVDVIQALLTFAKEQKSEFIVTMLDKQNYSPCHHAILTEHLTENDRRVIIQSLIDAGFNVDDHRESFEKLAHQTGRKISDFLQDTSKMLPR